MRSYEILGAEDQDPRQEIDESEEQSALVQSPDETRKIFYRKQDGQLAIPELADYRTQTDEIPL